MFTKIDWYQLVPLDAFGAGRTLHPDPRASKSDTNTRLVCPFFPHKGIARAKAKVNLEERAPLEPCILRVLNSYDLNGQRELPLNQAFDLFMSGTFHLYSRTFSFLFFFFFPSSSFPSLSRVLDDNDAGKGGGMWIPGP